MIVERHKSLNKNNELTCLHNVYIQYLKKRNTYNFVDNQSYFKDIHFKLAGYLGWYVCHKMDRIP